MQWVSSVAVLSDGRIVSGSGDKTIRVWDATTGATTQVLRGHDEVRVYSTIYELFYYDACELCFETHCATTSLY